MRTQQDLTIRHQAVVGLSESVRQFSYELPCIRRRRIFLPKWSIL